MDANHHDVIAGSTSLPRLATAAGIVAALSAGLSLSGVTTGMIADHLIHLAAASTITAIVLGAQAILDRRTGRRLAALYDLHRKERTNADQRHQDRMKASEERHARVMADARGTLDRVLAAYAQDQRDSQERHEHALTVLDQQHRQGVLDLESRWRQEIEAARKDHREVVTRLLAEVAQLTRNHDEAVNAAEARGLQRGRGEVEQVADIQLAAQQERHEAEMARLRQQAEENLRLAVAEARGRAQAATAGSPSDSDVIVLPSAEAIRAARNLAGKVIASEQRRRVEDNPEDT